LIVVELAVFYVNSCVLDIRIMKSTFANKRCYSHFIVFIFCSLSWYEVGPTLYDQEKWLVATLWH